MPSESKLLPVDCQIQRMGFGPLGKDSVAYQMFLQGGHAARHGQSDDGPRTPFAELWMGSSHEKGDGTCPTLNNKRLSEVLLGEKSEFYLGQELRKRFPTMLEKEHGGVPFIFKVLSAGKPLPLQVHPNLETGRTLRKDGTVEQEDRTVFDSMHKPEIALALTEFEAFLGFAPRETIRQRLCALPALRSLANARSDGKFGKEENTYDVIVSNDKDGEWRKMMSNLTGRLMSSSSKEIQGVIREIVAQDNKNKDKEIEQVVHLIKRCNDAHPNGDSGVLYAPVFMNYANLKPGECLYAPADTIHAWLSGSIIECMPSSVNVINSGFGPKPDERSLDLFTTMLSYQDLPLSKFILPAEPHDGGKVSLYEVPEEEFSVLGIELGPNDETTLLDQQPLRGISVAFSFEGTATVHTSSTDAAGVEESFDLLPGKVVLIGNGVTVRFSTSSERFRGYVSLTHFP